MRCNSNYRGNQNGRGNSNGGFNQNGFPCGGNFSPFNNQQRRNQSNRGNFNTCNVLAAITSEPETITTTTATALPLDKILYRCGNAISARAGGSRIYITEPGLYQVSYLVCAENTAQPGPPSTTGTTAKPDPSNEINIYVLENTTQIATQSCDTKPPCGTCTLSDTEIFYVSCQDLPVSLALIAQSTSTSVNYQYSITVNKICSCSNETDCMGSNFDSEFSPYDGNSGFNGMDGSFSQQGPFGQFDNGLFNGNFFPQGSGPSRRKFPHDDGFGR